MNEPVSLNLLELEVMLRLLNKQFITYDNKNIHFVKDGALVSTITVRDYERRIDYTPEQDMESIMTQAKCGQIIILAAGATGNLKNVTAASFAAKEDFKNGKYGKIFEDAWKNASKESKEHYIDNCTTLNNPTYKRAMDVVMRRESILSHGQTNFDTMASIR